MSFQEFAKIARLNREMVVTEKIDGTNAQIFIEESVVDNRPVVCQVGNFVVHAGSRTRWVTPEQDNHGFAKWVWERADELLQLGPGRHFGEWWGAGIQRGYGLPKGEKRFSLFNTSRWVDRHTLPPDMAGCSLAEKQAFAPDCCHVVPVLYRGKFDTAEVKHWVHRLRIDGSFAAPGFMKPEGVVVYHVAANLFFKVTVEKDELPKSFVK